MGESIIRILTAAPPLELLLIFILKIIEMTIGTVRLLLIRKGYRREGTLLAFVQIMMWSFVASRVIMGIADAPVKGVVYAVGFSIGIYIGSRVESYLAIGRVLIQTIVSRENSSSIISGLREKGYAVTSMDARGRDSERTVLKIIANRKGKEEIINDISRLDNTAMIITNDISTLKGGTVASARKPKKRAVTG